MNSITESDIARFWNKVKIGSPDECWEWQGKLDEKDMVIFSFLTTTLWAEEAHAHIEFLGSSPLE